MLKRLSNERTVLRFSIAVTVLLAVVGIAFGVLSGSYAIVFDGFYSLTDAFMSGVALLVAMLIHRHAQEPEGDRRLAERFNMGFWHLEPMVLALNGSVLCIVACYALVNSIISLMSGGKALAFGMALLYALVAALSCFGFAALVHRLNRDIQSDFLRLDIKSWIMSGSISAALVVAFLIGALAQGTAYAWITPYIDPLVLSIICVLIIPIPLKLVWQAVREILMVTPPALKQQVDEIARDMVARFGFLDYRAYVAKVGRARQIELYFIVPLGWPAKTLDEWDAIRDQIGEAIGGEGPDRWLTIAFTTDPAWSR